MSRKFTYKTFDLFGNESVLFETRKTRRTPNLFTDYDEFLDKFEIKKTTDDCYTPVEVYKIIVDYVHEHCDINNKKIIRPFYPGADYESIEYPQDAVVIDNPPFSIISKIAKYYIKNNVKFFLFAPHLTLFSSNIDCTHIVVGGDITYENGATIKTSFLSNMFNDKKIIGDPTLLEKFVHLQNKNKANLPKYVYPPTVLTVSSVSWIVERGIHLIIEKKDAYHYRGLESQKKYKKAIFGSGFLISEKAAAEKAAAEKAAAEKAAAEKAAAEKAAAENDNVIIWELSGKEIEIVKSLGEIK